MKLLAFIFIVLLLIPLFGCEKIVDCETCLKTGKVICSNCFGSNEIIKSNKCNYCREGFIECYNCNGIGQTECSECNGSNLSLQICLVCGGSGFDLSSWSNRICYVCGGGAMTMQPCRKCDFGLVVCKECFGDKKFSCRKCSGVGKIFEEIECYFCDRDGNIECQNCNGEGILKK